MRRVEPQRLKSFFFCVTSHCVLSKWFASMSGKIVCSTTATKLQVFWQASPFLEASLDIVQFTKTGYFYPGYGRWLMNSQAITFVITVLSVNTQQSMACGNYVITGKPTPEEIVKTGYLVFRRTIICCCFTADTFLIFHSFEKRVHVVPATIY